MAKVAVSQRMCMPEVGVLECENMDEVNSTVWIGFMDIVPVIGSVKESVELVLAVYEGDEKVIKEKEKALENILLGHVRQATQTQCKPAAEAPEFSGLLNVREVAKGKIEAYVNKGSTTKLSENEKKARAAKLEKVKQQVVENLKSIGQPFNGELKEELKRSKRGEHVFNNDILKFHLKVLQDFIKKNRIESLKGYNKQTLDQLHVRSKHSLCQNTERDIQYKMVAVFDPDEFYVNANASVYGVFSKVLHDAFLNVPLMSHIYSDADTKGKEQKVIRIINSMNDNEIYVDQFAKEKWIGNNDNRLRRFKEVRKEVVEMYRTDRGLDWYTNIQREVAPWFE